MLAYATAAPAPGRGTGGTAPRPTTPRAAQRPRPAVEGWPQSKAPPSAPEEHFRHASQKYSSWSAVEEGALDGHDYLYELGRQSASMNIDMGQNRGNLDRLFAGGYLGQLSDIASGKLRYSELRTLEHLDGEYHVPAAFLDSFVMHMTKNYLTDKIGGEMPLCLGIWGKKGCGKSFMVELCCKAMGVEPIIMSAGELEDEWAGNPGKLIRERYRAAAMVIKNQGKMSCLVINDLDAGAGRFANTHVTVNNQMVSGTLMNLCDDPHQVSVGQEWREEDLLPRVPIIVTANDLSTLYAPLLRDGRMEKYYWEPTYTDLHRMIHTVFQDDGYTEADIERLMQAHSDQPLDFFGALRARMYDDGILNWMRDDVGEARIPDVFRDLARPCRGLDQLVIGKEVPQFSGDGLDMSIERLLKCGQELQQEQQNVKDHQLAQDYMRWQVLPELVPMKKRRELTEEELQAAEEAREALAANSKRMLQEAAARAEEYRKLREVREAEEAEFLRLNPPPPPPPEPEPAPWRVVTPLEAAEQLIGEQGWTLVDVRSARDFGKESAFAFGVRGIASVSVTGRPLAYEVERVDGWLEEMRAAFPERSQAKLIIMGGGPNELGPHVEDTEALLQELIDDGYSELALGVGGYENWQDFWSPAGKKRPPKGDFKTDMFSSGTMCVGSDLPVVGTV